MNHSLFGKFSFLCGFTLPWELGFLKLGELGYLGLHQAQFFPVASAEASSKDTVVRNNSSKSIKPLTAGVLLSFLAYKGQKFAAKELQQGLDAHEPFLNSSSISVISTLIKQSRRSQIYRLQNRGTDDTFQALGKPFGYMDVQTYLQVLYPLCFKISQILFK